MGNMEFLPFSINLISHSCDMPRKINALSIKKIEFCVLSNGSMIDELSHLPYSSWC